MKMRTVSTLIVFFIIFGVAFERFTLPETTDNMRTQALEYGKKHGKVLPPQPFVYDGCTFFFDTLLGSDFMEACLVHDIAYWYGGREEEKIRADKKLSEAIEGTGSVGAVVHNTVYVAVWVFGDSILTRSVDAHWGFGWD